MRYWKHGNDLYTADTQPVEGAAEITAEEYAAIYNSREIKHLPEMEQEQEALMQEDATDADHIVREV